MKMKAAKGTIVAVLLVLPAIVFAQNQNEWKKEFANPLSEYRFHTSGSVIPPVGNNNSPFGGIMEPNSIKYTNGYGGVELSPSSRSNPAAFSEEWFKFYRASLEEAKQSGKTAVLYDDVDYPSGTAYNRIASEFPELLAPKLRALEKNISGPVVLDAVKMDYEGELLGAIAWNMGNNERLNISDKLSEDKKLTFTLPGGRWKIMVFSLVRNGRLIDYMDPAAMDKYIELVYGSYYSHLSEYFGTVITKCFFDDVGFWYFENYWNKACGEIFREHNGMDPLLYYPAFWYNIGEETNFARNELFRIRAQRIGDVFAKKLTDWCTQHHIACMGHVPGNYDPNPNEMYGDPFKFYKYQPIPLSDIIGGYAAGRPGWKFPGSVGILNNHQLAGSEVFGAFPQSDMNGDKVYMTIMEAMTRGISFFVPFGQPNYPDNYNCYRAKQVPQGINAIQDYNLWAGRSCFLLQNGRTIADIALVYPVESIYAYDSFWGGITDVDGSVNGNKKTEKDANPMLKAIGGAGGGLSERSTSTLTAFGLLDFGAANRLKSPAIPKERVRFGGGLVPPDNNYMKIGDQLTGNLRRDFNFVEADEFISNKFIVKKGYIKMDQPDTWQEYKLVIVPSSNVIQLKMLKKLKDYYEAGGKILFTGNIAFKSSEPGKDAELAILINKFLSLDSQPEKNFSLKNSAGGRILYITKATSESLKNAVNDLLPNGDVLIDPVPGLDRPDFGDVVMGIDFKGSDVPQELVGEVSYIHKVKDGRDVYMFINSSLKSVSTKVCMRGRKKLEQWNPHSGSISKWETSYLKINGEDYTTFTLDLTPVTSLFAVGE
jgi:hypothetical protein